MAVASSPDTMNKADSSQLAALVERFGFRISNLDARRVGVRERVLFDAVVAGLAKIERAHVAGDQHIATTYVVFA